MDHPEAESRSAYPGWRVVLASAVGVFFASLVVVTFPVFLKPWAAEFAWSRREVSVAFGIAAACAGLSAAPLGHLLDRFGARRIVVPCLFLYGVLFASLGRLSPPLWHLYAWFAALGVVAVGTSPVAYARAVSTWFSTRRGLALAIVVTGGALGGVLLPVATEALIRQVGWRATCVVFGSMVALIGTPLAMRFVRERPASAESSAALDGATVGEGLRARVFWLLALVQLLGTMVQNGVLVHLSALLTDRGVPPERAALALSAMAAASVAGRMVTGLVIDRAFAPRVLLAVLALAAAGAWLLSGASSFGVAVAAAVLVGFGTGGEADIIPYLLSRYFGLRSFSALFGLVWLANAIGGALGPVLMGRAFDTAGSYEAMLLRLSIAVLVAAGLSLALPRYRSAPRVSEAMAPQ